MWRLKRVVGLTVKSPCVPSRSFHVSFPPRREFIDWGTGFDIHTPQLTKEPYQKLPKLNPSVSVPLTQPFPGVPSNSQFVQKFSSNTTEITTLSNGLKVATQETFGPATAFALFVNSGTIYETEETQGVSHIIERMAFKKSSSKDLVQELELSGGNISSSSSREVMSYFAEVVHEKFPRTLELISEAVCYPKFAEDELEEVKQQIAYELSQMRIDSLFTELVHQEAFAGEPLGRTFYSPLEQLSQLSVRAVSQFHQQLYHPDRMVLAVVGPPHKEAVSIAEKIFGSVPRSSETIALPQSTYRGGTRLMEEQEGDVDPLSRNRPVSHISLTFGTPGLDHPDMYALYTLNILLGGGGSFSSGGPGKGMYSRLYRQVLNGYHFVESCYAFYSGYRHNGIFGIFGTVDHGRIPEMLEVIADTFLRLLVQISPEEFQRAKNQLKSSVLMGLETRAILADDIARQVTYYGKHISMEEICQRIDALTADDLRRVVFQFLQTRPTLVAHGQNVPNLPDADTIQNYFKSQTEDYQQQFKS